MNDASVGADGGPFEERRQMYELLSQETRHLILQYVLGHPSHLPSLDELAYLVPKNKSAIREQLEVLVDAGILELYEHPPNGDARDLPSQFYGLTETGVEILSEYEYLRGLPVVRALYENTRLSEKVQRHRDAPRPELPEEVTEALVLPGEDEAADFDRVERYVREHGESTNSVDDQVELLKAFYRAGVDTDHEGVGRTEMLDELSVELEHPPETVLQHLTAVGLVEKTSPSGPDVFAISERLDEIVNGRIVQEAQENIEALISHFDDELQSVELTDGAAERGDVRMSSAEPSVALADGGGRTIRRILATEFDVAPERAADYLQEGDPVERLNEAIRAIESSDEVSKSEEYGRIVFLNTASRYRLTDRAMDLIS